MIGILIPETFALMVIRRSLDDSRLSVSESRNVTVASAKAATNNALLELERQVIKVVARHGQNDEQKHKIVMTSRNEQSENSVCNAYVLIDRFRIICFHISRK